MKCFTVTGVYEVAKHIVVANLGRHIFLSQELEATQPMILPRASIERTREGRQIIEEQETPTLRHALIHLLVPGVIAPSTLGETATSAFPTRYEYPPETGMVVEHTRELRPLGVVHPYGYDQVALVHVPPDSQILVKFVHIQRGEWRARRLMVCYDGNQVSCEPWDPDRDRRHDWSELKVL